MNQSLCGKNRRACQGIGHPGKSLRNYFGVVDVDRADAVIRGSNPAEPDAYTCNRVERLERGVSSVGRSARDSHAGQNEPVSLFDLLRRMVYSSRSRRPSAMGTGLPSQPEKGPSIDTFTRKRVARGARAREIDRDRRTGGSEAGEVLVRGNRTRLIWRERRIKSKTRAVPRSQNFVLASLSLTLHSPETFPPE